MAKKSFVILTGAVGAAAVVAGAYVARRRRADEGSAAAMRSKRVDGARRFVGERWIGDDTLLTDEFATIAEDATVAAH